MPHTPEAENLTPQGGRALQFWTEAIGSNEGYYTCMIKVGLGKICEVLCRARDWSIEDAARELGIDPTLLPDFLKGFMSDAELAELLKKMDQVFGRREIIGSLNTQEMRHNILNQSLAGQEKEGDSELRTRAISDAVWQYLQMSYVR